MVAGGGGRKGAILDPPPLFPSSIYFHPDGGFHNMLAQNEKSKKNAASYLDISKLNNAKYQTFCRKSRKILKL